MDSNKNVTGQRNFNTIASFENWRMMSLALSEAKPASIIARIAAMGPGLGFIFDVRMYYRWRSQIAQKKVNAGAATVRKNCLILFQASIRHDYCYLIALLQLDSSK